MRRIFLLFAFVFASVGGAIADEISSATALRIASEALRVESTRSCEMMVAWDSNALTATRSGSSVPSFYVVAAESGRGFVVVAGDDAISPILAYSAEYPAPDFESMHPALEGWFRSVDKAVRYARLSNLAPDASTAQMWARPSVATSSIRLNTARWSQYLPYNKYCPLDGDSLSLTGCTQTAMAEVMHYYKWPERAKGTTEPFTTITKGIEVGSRDLNHSYDWANMLDEYVEGKYNDAEGDAVAVLMADLGHAFKADYASEATGALPDAVAMFEKFGYSPACHYIMRDGFTQDGWNAILRSEIESSRPVFYSGYTADNFGHAFVLDGVDDDDYFHINWGWGGVGDGFFKLDALVLNEYVFDAMHWAFLGIHPLRSGEADNLLYVGAPGISISQTEFAEDEPFMVEGVSIVNPSVLDFSGEVRFGVSDIDGGFKSWASEAIAFELPTMYGTSVVDVEVVVEEKIVSGDRLRVFFRSSDGKEWHPMLPYQEGARYEVVLKYPSIGETTSLSFDKSTELITVRYEDNVDASLQLLGEDIESGVEKSKGRMIVNTKHLKKGTTYTIYFEREDGEAKIMMFALKDM